MKQQTHKKRMETIRTALCLFLLFILFFPGVKAQTTSYTKAESFLFSFKENNDMFLAVLVITPINWNEWDSICLLSVIAC